MGSGSEGSSDGSRATGASFRAIAVPSSLVPSRAFAATPAGRATDPAAVSEAACSVSSFNHLAGLSSPSLRFARFPLPSAPPGEMLSSALLAVGAAALVAAQAPSCPSLHFHLLTTSASAPALTPVLTMLRCHRCSNSSRLPLRLDSFGRRKPARGHPATASGRAGLHLASPIPGASEPMAVVPPGQRNRIDRL